MEIIRGKIPSAQKVILYGPEGIGKSTLASRFPNPLFIDVEGSTKLLDVARTPQPSSWAMLLDQVQYVKSHPDICDTLIIDTADWAEQLASADVCARANKQGIEDFGYGKGYVYLAEEFGRLLNLLSDVIDLGINVVFTAHAAMRKFEQPDESGAYDRWELKLQRRTAPLLKEWADLVLFANYKTYVVKDENDKAKAQGGARVIHTSHHPCWDAKNRHGLPEELKLDYSEIAHIIPIRGQAPVAASTSSAAPALKPELTFGETVEPPVPVSRPSTPSGVPKALGDLMAANNVTVDEIQAVVAHKGYYPADTPIANYDPGFIDGVLVGAWSQVFGMIQTLRGGI